MKRLNKLFVAILICAFLAAVGCSAPKPVKLDGAERVPVNKVGAEKDWGEGGEKK
jgi:hypothetical protein